jgi:hypothetical protein
VYYIYALFPAKENIIICYAINITAFTTAGGHTLLTTATLANYDNKVTKTDQKLS